MRSIFRNRYLFSFAKIVQQQPQLNQEQLKDYQMALNFIDRGKYRLALDFFKRFQKLITTPELQQSEYQYMALKKIAYIQNILEQDEQCEQTLELIIQKYQEQKANEALIYNAYNNLFLHCLRNNLSKALLIGKALLQTHEVKNIPIAYIKQFHFNYGTAHLLKENYAEAKQHFKECLISEPSPLLKGFTLNNMAVASWLHKYPYIREFLSDDEDDEHDNIEKLIEDTDYPSEKIEEDFQNVIPLFKRSIKTIESTVNDNNNEAKRNYLDHLLDENHIIPENIKKIQLVGVMLQHKLCGIPLLNITEFIFNTDPKKIAEAQFWFKFSLTFFEKVDPENIDRSLILLAYLCSASKQNARAEALFRMALSMIEEKDTYNKVLAMQLLGNMLKQQEQTEEEGRSKILIY